MGPLGPIGPMCLMGSVSSPGPAWASWDSMAPKGPLQERMKFGNCEFVPTKHVALVSCVSVGLGATHACEVQVGAALRDASLWRWYRKWWRSHQRCFKALFGEETYLAYCRLSQHAL